jgi:hypothetical protein
MYPTIAINLDNFNCFYNGLPMAKSCVTQGCYSNTLKLTGLGMQIEKNEVSIICWPTL